MLQNIQALYGKKLGASDGDIGHVNDFYFDDTTWAVRYVVANTGSWLPGRQVLLPPHAFGAHALGSYGFGTAAADDDVLRVTLTRKQIEDSPPIDSDRPVSRQYEESYYRYYGWPMYWQGAGMWSGAGFPVVVPATIPERPTRPEEAPGNVHLRSTKAVTGYAIHATDGEIGSVSGFMVATESWVIRKLVVEAGHWYAGKPILLLPENVTRISYEDSSVFVNLTKADIERTAKNEVAEAGAGRS